VLLLFLLKSVVTGSGGNRVRVTAGSADRAQCAPLGSGVTGELNARES